MEHLSSSLYTWAYRYFCDIPVECLSLIERHSLHDLPDYIHWQTASDLSVAILFIRHSLLFYIHSSINFISGTNMYSSLGSVILSYTTENLIQISRIKLQSSFPFFADWQANTIVTLRPASEVGVKTLRLTRRNKKCAMSVNNTPPHTCCHNVLRVWRVLIMKPTEGKISLWDSLRIYKCSH